MNHKPIQLKNITLSFPYKTCFSDFSAQICSGYRIGIIGRNGSGKSTLLRMMYGLESSEGEIIISNDVRMGYIPQVVEAFPELSGSQRFNKSLTRVLTQDPNVLILDEPTNHLDRHNRRSLIRLLNEYAGTLIIVSHDVELLRAIVRQIWFINNNTIKILQGKYDDIINEINREEFIIQKELLSLKQKKKKIHCSLMKEQTRSKNSRLRGEKHIRDRKWPTIVSSAKARRATTTAGNKKRMINDKREELLERLSHISLSEEINPKFCLGTNDNVKGPLVYINNGGVGYSSIVLDNINLTIMPNDRCLIEGDNGSGKTTILKAILTDPKVTKMGVWQVPKVKDIGYLDQHYSNLNSDKTAVEIIAEIQPHWTTAEIRYHLSDYLFRKDEEVNLQVSYLSGGEKARLSLAQIAVHPPKLLILDEMTNNLDLETRQHVIAVLRKYPGALLVVSHDADFIDSIGIDCRYHV